MKNRNALVYLMTTLILLSFAVPGLAQFDPPGPTPTRITIVGINPAVPELDEQFSVEVLLEKQVGENSWEALGSGYSLDFALGDGYDANKQLTEVLLDGGSATTGSNGHATYTFTETLLDVGEPADIYDLRVYYGGSTAEDLDKTTNISDLEVNKIATVLEVRIKPAPKADTINHPACGYCDRQPLDKSSRFRLDGQSYTFIHTPYRIRGWF